jgi:hypothetical protein
MSSLLRNVDVFVKPRSDLRSKSVAGGVVTLIATTTAILLLIAQLYLYVVGTKSHSLHVATSTKFAMLPQDKMDPFQSRDYDIRGKIPLKLHITFPHLDCRSLEVKLNGQPINPRDLDGSSMSHSNGSKKKALDKRRPNPVELKRMLGDRGIKDIEMVGQYAKYGCTLYGQLRVPIVAGHVSVTLTREAWTSALNYFMARSHLSDDQRINDRHKNDYNMTHFIHTVQFGKKVPPSIVTTSSTTTTKNNNNKASSSSSSTVDRPLENRMNVIENHMGGIALENIQVKLVPTVSSGLLYGDEQYYQMSVVDHTIQPETMVSQGVSMQPGLTLSYDVTPLAVHHNEGRDNIFIFLSSLISIVGGVFVTVSLFTGCLVHSATAVAKKMD